MQPAMPYGYSPLHDRWGAPISAGVSLRALSVGVQALLLGSLAILGNWIWAETHERHIAELLLAHRSVSLIDAQDADDTLNGAGHLVIGAYLVTGVVFVVWFALMRRNAEGYDPEIHRRSRGWAVGGWICPVVSFWFPY